MLARSTIGTKLTSAIIDLVAVAVGVLLALWADQWWSDRQDAYAEQAYLSALHEDITTSLQAIDATSAEISNYLAAASTLSKLPVEGPYPPNEELISLIGAGLFNLEVFEFSLPALQDLKNTGRLGLISQQEIRLDLARLEMVLEELRTSEEDLVASQHSLFDPFLVAHTDLAAVAKAGVTPRDIRAALASDGPVGSDYIGNPVGLDHSALMSDPKFRGVLAVRIVILSTMLVNSKNVRTLLISLQQQIRAEDKSV